jgi:hypothetical protein
MKSQRSKSKRTRHLEAQRCGLRAAAPATQSMISHDRPLRSQVAPNRPAPAAARFRPVAHVQRGGTRSIATPLDITIHGRHVDVTPEARSILAALQRQEGARGRRVAARLTITTHACSAAPSRPQLFPPITPRPPTHTPTWVPHKTRVAQPGVPALAPRPGPSLCPDRSSPTFATACLPFWTSSRAPNSWSPTAASPWSM